MTRPTEFPGIPKWGAKTSAQVLGRYGHIEQIPDHSEEWDVALRGARAIAASLAEHRQDALLYKKLATLRVDVPIKETLAQLEWHGVRRQDYQELRAELGFSGLPAA